MVVMKKKGTQMNESPGRKNDHKRRNKNEGLGGVWGGGDKKMEDILKENMNHVLLFHGFSVARYSSTVLLIVVWMLISSYL
jgi:hypothetical protein